MRMPGRSWSGPPPPQTPRQHALAAELQESVQLLAGEIGERSLRNPRGLAAAADHIHDAFERSGLATGRHELRSAGATVANIEATIPGATLPGEIVIAGAHYDSVMGTVGADDNASGVAALLALARRFAGRTADLPSDGAPRRPARTLRFVAFANEEPPYFATSDMGSLAYARRSRARSEKITAMLSFDGLGYFSDEPGSQRYPFPLAPFFPDRGDFLAFAGNLASARLVRRAIAAFRRHAQLPSEGAALPGWLPGVGWSDHWSFWQVGYPALMVTDTLPFRFPWYHTPADRPETIDYARMARGVEGLEGMFAELVG